MTPHNVKRLLFGLFALVMLFVSVKYGFGHAWQSQYTFASVPASLTAATHNSASQAAVPPNVPVPDVPGTDRPQPLSKRVVEYHIHVALRDDGRHLDGAQDITWTNPGKKAVSELYFHLYPNAFQSPKTTFMSESGGKLRQDKATSGSVSHMKLLSLDTLEGESLLPRLQYLQPDDGNKHDFTLARIRLPEPVAPGKSVTLKLGFEVKLPEVFARMGYYDDFVMAGQWFPKLAVYETSGTRDRDAEGWNVHQYHGNSEFYSDFGIYSVRIQVPETHIVAATGFQTKPVETRDGSNFYQFYAEDVHDFAWAASPNFVYEEAVYSDKGIPGVRIKLFLDPLHAELKDRYMHAAKSALSSYAKWYGDYPYTTLSIIVPPKGANGAGGMEYPTLITAFAAEDDNPGYQLERTVVHEIGHQYWYGMVASNEFEEAWLDEGFTSYSEDKVMESAYGLVSNLRMEASYMTDPAPLMQPSWSYGSHSQYAENVYMRAKLVLVDIENKVGERTMAKIMRTYFQQYKFRHPGSTDFQKVVEKVTKQNWTPYFNQFVYGGEMADFAIEAIRVQPVDRDGERAYESTVLVRRHGGANGPVPVVLAFADGSEVRKEWSGEGSHIQYTELHPYPLLWAAVDPEHTNVLDNKLINNYMTAELPKTARTRLSFAVTKLAEGILGSLGW